MSVKYLTNKISETKFEKNIMEEIIPWTYMSNDLILAVYNDDVKKVEELILEGADINVCDSSGNSLLWSAYIKNYHEIVFVLLNAGVDVNLKSGNLLMCDVHRACVFANKSFIELLLACDGDVNIEDVNGQTPLMLSIEYRSHDNSLDVIDLLIDNGAEINHQDANGLTVLHYACQRARLDIIEIFIKKNANPCLKNSIGVSPITYALTYFSYTSSTDPIYNVRFKIAEKFFNLVNSEYELIKSAIFDTPFGPNLNAIFDLIFYGRRSKHAEYIDMGWQMFHSINWYRDFDRDISYTTKVICQNNKSDLDVIYYLSNIQINNVYDLILAYVSRSPYEQNIKRANILFYYCITADEGKCIYKLSQQNKNILIQNYIDITCLLLNLKCQKPSSLKSLCRSVIRNCLKYSIRFKLNNLWIPNELKDYILINELYSLTNRYSLIQLIENI